jgi:hypothetical protein
MKLLKQFLVGLSLAVLVGLFGASKAQAQVWAFYDEEIVNIFFNPLVGGNITVLNDFQFQDFNGDVDRDDGVVNNVPVGFTFDYNSDLFSTVNVCINGWASVGPQSTPVITHDVFYLFRPNQPNNTLAPFWGDHFYRTGSDISDGYKPSKIHYSTVAVPDMNPCAPPGSVLKTFTLEWKDLNINEKSNVNSIGTFQIKIIQNPMANDCNVPDHRATIQFHYGPIGNAGTVKTQGSSVGIEDSVSDILAHSFMNGLFPSSVNGEQDTRLNDDSLTTCWPPATCLPGRVIQFTPEGRGRFEEWGDGDVNLTQLDPTLDGTIRLNQNRFVTLADADSLLRATAIAYPPLDSVEGRQAFHGDANHDGRYTNPLYPGFFFYRANAYDAAYILMYLAAKLPILPWPDPLPVPVYKETGNEETNINGLYADVKAARVEGGTTYVPVVLQGTVNGAFSIEMDVKSLNEQVLQFIGAESDCGLIYANAALGNIAFAAAGKFADGDVVAYLQFAATTNAIADFELSNVKINDKVYPGSRSTLSSGVGTGNEAAGFRLEQNSPNPFNMNASSITTIRFSLTKPEVASLKIFDVLGNEVRALATGEMMGAGEHALGWDGRTSAGTLVTTGTYYYTLTTSSETLTSKLQVIR